MITCRNVCQVLLVCVCFIIVSCTDAASIESPQSMNDVSAETPVAMQSTAQVVDPTIAAPTLTPLQSNDTIAIPLTAVLWQDTFDNPASGWEPRYEVTQTDYNRVDPVALADPRLYAWNGYDNGGYSFYLPGIPDMAGDTAAVLWDFNATYQLPAYPYRVRADVAVNPAGNGMLLLDYVGDFGAIDKGDGIAVTWGHNDGRSYKYVDVWQLTVYEFHQGRTWALGCSNAALSNLVSSTSSAVVDVDATAIDVTIYGGNGRVEYTATCARVQPGQGSAVRHLGIGSVYTRPVVPGNDYNTLTFEDVYVMAGESVTGGADFFQVRGGCVVGWMGYWEDEGDVAIDVVSAIESQTDCRNGYASFSSDFPGYGVERIAMPNADMLTGAWACGGDAPTSRFRFERRGDDVTLMVGDTAWYVYYAKDVEDNLRGHTITDVPTEAYIVTDSTQGGNMQTFESVDVVQIGDGISVRGQHNYYFTIDGDQIITNWTALPCTRE